MKKVNGFLLSLFCVSCVADEVPYCYDLKIKNDTKFNITIEGFLKGKLIKSIDVLSNNEKSFFLNIINYSNGYSIFEQDIDSVNMKFNKEKIIIQHCGGLVLSGCIDIEKNILTNNLIKDRKFMSYKLLKKDGCKVYKDPVVYTINQSDYDRAVPIKK